MEFYRINAQMLPKVNFVDETEIRPPYVHRKRRAGEQILYFIRHGEMHLLEDGKPLILKPGDVCLLDKDRTHEGTKATTCNYYYVHFMHGEMELVDAKEEEVARQQFERRRKAMAKEPCEPYGSYDECEIWLPKYWHIKKVTDQIHIDELIKQAIAEDYSTFDKEPGIPGHQEVEIGLMKLYRATGKEKYKDMARYFLEERGKNPNYFYEEKKKRGWQHWGQYSLEPLDQRYTQTHATIYEQKEAVGHSVRAVYMYTAMADLAGEDKDERLYEACQTLWDNIVKKRMYITGGIGSTVEGEAFTIDYDLPNDMAYAETCASIGMIFFAKRMLEIRPLGIYADIMEREFYNGTISGIQLDGKQFFYVNPLETNPGTSGTIFGYKHVLPTRPGWYACACCPPNLVRLVTSLGTYAWSESDTTLYSHLFLGQTADFEKAVVKVDSSYPWEGKVTYQVKAKMKDAFELAIHIPSHIRMDTLCVTVNGEKTDAASCIKDGYLYLKQNWGENDVVALTFDLPVRKIYANTNVREDEGCVALMRGPVVYCFEGADNGECIQALRIPREIKAETELCKEGVLAGNVLIHLPGYRMESSDALYSEERPKRTDVTLTAIPYYAWANRGENQMRVWMPEE